MIITRTPFRISFLGGGTDYPRWYRNHGGAVIATTIDKYCYLSCRYLPPFFEHRIRLVYSKIENCQTVDEIAHPSVREALKYLEVTRGVEIHHDGDLPARSGMGSSSAFTVGLLHALHALEGRMVSKRQLAAEGIHVEQELLRETVGSQDQVATAYGGLNHIRFLPSGEISVQPIIMSADRAHEFNSWLMLFYTGIKRTASGVAGTYVEDIEDRRRSMRILQDLVEEGLAVLSGGDLQDFGGLLQEAWAIKRSLSGKVTNDRVDGIYSDALEAGALGGKLLGAGGGGFMLLFVPPDRRVRVREKLSRLIHVPFKFESQGSQVVLFDQEVDYSHEDLARQGLRTEQFQELCDEADCFAA
jgi:D-glycero-alpha-D-manno-heptose-7-phosphate kinase